jgi:anti-sigma factor RsiW
MTTHDSWTDKLSDYLDDELPPDEHAEVTAHLAQCPECWRTLAELKRVVAAASGLAPVPPRADLWKGVAARIAVTPRHRPPRSFSFTLPQLAAASLLLATLSGGAVAYVLMGTIGRRNVQAGVSEAAGATATANPPTCSTTSPEQPDSQIPDATAFGADVVPAVGYADAQFDAAVADLERALEAGRNRLDPETIGVVEDNLSIIDRAIAEARRALQADPANGYLSGHLREARRRKLDLLRRATALTEAN